MARLLSSRVFSNSLRVGVYVSSERLREVDTHALLRELFLPTCSKQCFVPLVGPGRAELHFVRIGAGTTYLHLSLQILSVRGAQADMKTSRQAAWVSLSLQKKISLIVSRWLLTLAALMRTERLSVQVSRRLTS